MRHIVKFVTLGCIVLLSPVQAQTSAGDEQPPDRRTIEPGVPVGSIDIRELKEGGQTITEYRRFGHLYMLKVEPKGGAPLYLINQYGDSQLNTRSEDTVAEDVNLPKWRIGRF